MINKEYLNKVWQRIISALSINVQIHRLQLTLHIWRITMTIQRDHHYCWQVGWKFPSDFQQSVDCLGFLCLYWLPGTDSLQMADERHLKNKYNNF